MNEDAVKRFVEVTHEAYRREIGGKFGKTVPGIFTDEPCYNHHAGAMNLPWTVSIPERFQEKYGYDLLISCRNSFLKVIRKSPEHAGIITIC